VKQEDPHERRLPVQRAFVVQWAATADVAQGHLAGRVEHVLSGHAMQFHILADLLAFMARVLASKGCSVSHLQELDAEKGGQHCRNTGPGRSEMSFMVLACFHAHTRSFQS